MNGTLSFGHLGLTVSCAVLATTIHTLALSAQSVENSTSEVLATICSSISTESMTASCDASVGFKFKSPDSEISFSPIFADFAADKNLTVKATTYEPYRALDGAKLVALSIFNPTAVQYADVGQYVPLMAGNLSDAMSAAIEAGLASGEVEFAISSSASNEGTIVAFQPVMGADEVYVRELVNGVTDAYANSGSNNAQLGIVASTAWYESTGNSAGFDATGTKKVLTLSPSAAFTPTITAGQ